MEEADLIVIGSGQGGVPLAAKMAGRGARVAVFERDRAGGSCVNWGCTPSKAFLAAAHAAGRARDARSLGVHAEVRVDFPAVMERVRRLRDQWTEGVEETFEREDLELIRAEASFTADGAVQGGGRTLRAPRVVIDTGTRAARPPIEGLDDVPVLDDRNVWELTERPERLLVIGGGYIGVELGQAMQRLGSRVTLVQRDENLLAREDPEVGAVVQEALARDGARVLSGREVVRAEHDPGEEGAVRLHLDDGSVLDGDALLLAAGRRPNTEALSAPSAGIELDEKGRVRVDANLATTRPGVWAIGDVAGQPPFTHVSWEDHRRLLASWDGQGRARDDRTLGYVVFSEPQVARAGLDYRQAQERGLRPRRARMEIAHTARGREWGHELGFHELVADGEGRLIGATLVGYEAGELVHALLDLIEAGAHWRQLDRSVHVHPTYAESLPVLARQLAE